MSCDLKVLVVGGAGYIGSHMVMRLHELDCQVVILDNLSNGQNQGVSQLDLAQRIRYSL